jgi:hypothetical protein
MDQIADIAKFADDARKLGSDDNEKRFEDRIRKLTSARPARQADSKSSKRKKSVK